MQLNITLKKPSHFHREYKLSGVAFPGNYYAIRDVYVRGFLALNIGLTCILGWMLQRTRTTSEANARIVFQCEED